MLQSSQHQEKVTPNITFQSKNAKNEPVVFPHPHVRARRADGLTSFGNKPNFRLAKPLEM